MPLFLWLGYIFFVVYAALVPLQYHDLSLHQAWAAFQKIPYVKLSIDLHADLIANGVLYIPVAFLTTYLLTQTFQKTPLLLLLAVAGVFSASLAVAVEFTQIFFPPRTVKLNDIFSEWLGSLVGLALATRYLNWFHTLGKSFWNDPPRLKTQLLEAYTVAYLAFSLFPFDILSSWPEFQAKIDSNAWGSLLAGDASTTLQKGFQLVSEVVLTAPFGILLFRLLGGSLASYKRAALVGMLLGCSIEVAQFFLYSGISQGLSVLSRALGVCCGVALCKHGDRWTVDRVAFILRRYTIPLVAAYLLALLYINRWFASSWHGLDFAAQQLVQVDFVPFYYHYYVGEAQALFSLLTVCLSYAPVALLAWAYRRPPWVAILVSLLLATGFEASKLFMQPGHPDPTNVLLACAASWLTLATLRRVFQNESEPTPTRHCERSAAIHGPVPIWLFLCLAATGVWAANFPAFPALVCLVLAACAAAVWRNPVWLFAIVPAALPVFDLAPWSGRFFLDEFDALLLVGLAVAFSRVPPAPRNRKGLDAGLTIAGGLVLLSFGISAVRGLMPFALPDANSFNTYFSPYNALRIVKGVGWAFMLIVLALRLKAAGVDARRPFAWGMVAGLAFTVAAILWERAAFSAMGNFSDGYRVTGPFSASHTGGAYVDCFLAAAIPFVLVLALKARSAWLKLGGVLLMLAATYALMVTFSRGGYLSLGVALAVVALFAVHDGKRRLQAGFALLALVGAVLLVAVPIIKGQFAQSRMAEAGNDLGFRQAHWQDALDMRDATWATTLFGMGVGRFPETKYWRSTLHPKVGTYRLQDEKGNSFLRLGSGDDPIVLDQFVTLEPGQTYLLKLDVRASAPGAKFVVPICEKWLLTSATCLAPAFDLGADFGAWRSVQSSITAEGFGQHPWYARRPVKLSLTYAVPHSTIDIDNVSLVPQGGANLLRNGDFTQGLDHWFFAASGTLHAHWRTHSLYYGVLFDQGWFGVAALGTFLLLVLGRGARQAWRGDALSMGALAALSGFLVGGVWDTQIDAPRFLMLLLLLAADAR